MTTTLTTEKAVHGSKLLDRIRVDISRSQSSAHTDGWHSDNHSDTWTDGAEHADGGGSR